MLKNRRTLGLAGVLVLVLAAIVAFWVLAAGQDRSATTRHRDGEGPLAALQDPGGSQEFKADPAAVDSWSYGLMICVAEGASVTLDSVVPHATQGSGFEHLGTVVRRLTIPGDSPIISVDGFPPSGSTPPLDVEGFVVDAPCQPRPPEVSNEIDIGLAQVGDDGGGWLGVDIHYVVDGRAYVLEAAANFLICGHSTPCD